MLRYSKDQSCSQVLQGIKVRQLLWVQKSNLSPFLSSMLYIIDRRFPVFSFSCNNRAEKGGVSYIKSE